MTASFARARARGTQLGVTTPVPGEKRGRECACSRGVGTRRDPPEFWAVASVGRVWTTSRLSFTHWAERSWSGTGGVILFGSQHFRADFTGSDQPSDGVQDSTQNETFSGSIVPFRPILSHPLLFIWSVRGVSREPKRGMQEGRPFSHVTTTLPPRLGCATQGIVAGGRDLHRGITLVPFRTGGREAGGSTEDLCTFTFAEGGRTGLGVCARSRAAPWRFWAKAGRLRAGRWLRIGPRARHLDRASAFP